VQRIRFSFALLAVLLLVPLALLLDRTLSGLDRERDQRHQVVANRVFDEAERALLEFLEEEELRAPEQYFASSADGRDSALSQPPARQFVIDYFQIGAAGRITSPRPERDSLLSLRLEGLLDDQPKREQISLEQRLDATGDLEKKMKALSAGKGRADIQRPGSTKTVQKLDLLERREVVEAEEANLELAEAKEDRPYSSYRMLEQLNLAGRSRAKKSSVARQIASEPTVMASASPSPPANEVPMRALAVGRVARQQIEGFADTDAVKARARDRADDQSASGSAARLQEQLAQSPMHRMASFAIDARHLILFRAVTIPGKGHFQQGLLLDLERLADWIENRVVVESGLARYIQFELAPIEELGALGYRAERRFIYDHRFDQPFEDLGARLSLTALPDTGGSANIYLMGLLLIAVSTLGLWAMYRRVAVAVHFAERRSNFAAAVSHELKTPLTAIRMYAEMLRDGMVPDEARRQEYYGTITSEAERLTRLINNVLEFSNLEKRTRKREITSGRVETNLREVIQILEPHAHSRGFTIKLKLEPDLPTVRFEADALQQILFNLIDNSLKYAEGATRKEIEVAAQAWEGGVRIRVRDYGAGVSAKHRPHLFEPFYRGETELTRRTKGTGIGLALVKGLAEEMNGEIRARNATGGGFEVELRLRE